MCAQIHMCENIQGQNVISSLVHSVVSVTGVSEQWVGALLARSQGVMDTCSK